MREAFRGEYTRGLISRAIRVFGSGRGNGIANQQNLEGREAIIRDSGIGLFLVQDI